MKTKDDTKAYLESLLALAQEIIDPLQARVEAGTLTPNDCVAGLAAAYEASRMAFAVMTPDTKDTLKKCDDVAEIFRLMMENVSEDPLLDVLVNSKNVVFGKETKQ